MTEATRTSLTSAAAALAAGVSLTPLTEDRTYLAISLLMIALGAMVGALLGRLRVGKPMIRAAQLLPLLVIPVVIPAASDPLELFARTYDFAFESVPPMPYEPGFAAFSAALVWAVYWMVEVLSSDLASPAWTFPILILPYAIPSIAIYPETSPLLFCLTAAGYAAVLANATSAALAPQTAADGPRIRWRTSLAATAALTTAIAATVAVALPLPERTSEGLSPGGTGSIQLGDPSLDLIRNVNSNSGQVVISYTTSDDKGLYLRQAALPVLDDHGFHLTATDLVPLPISEAPPSTPSESVHSTISIGNLAAEYLPTPWFPSSLGVGESWRYDPKTLSVVAVGNARTSATRNLKYDAVALRQPNAEKLLAGVASAGDPGDNGLTLALPDGLSTGVRRLAEEVTSDLPRKGDQAIALLKFLRSSGGFTYNTAAVSGTTLSTLDDFLLVSRTGYCEQFAGSLAVLARAVGIPSRVVVGFLPGQKVGRNWLVTPKNMHAWTELYFGTQIGWVSVDPTPSTGTSTQPSASASPSSPPSSASPEASATALPSQTTEETPAPGAGAGGASNLLLPLLIGALAATALVAAGPRVVRDALRRHRLAGSPDPRKAAELAWSETRAVAVDCGHAWPPGTSRQVADLIGPELDEPGRKSLRLLALEVERARYDATPAGSAEIRHWVGEITLAMRERWGPGRAKRWWPRSMWPTGR